MVWHWLYESVPASQPPTTLPCRSPTTRSKAEILVSLSLLGNNNTTTGPVDFFLYGHATQPTRLMVDFWNWPQTIFEVDPPPVYLIRKVFYQIANLVSRWWNYLVWNGNWAINWRTVRIQSMQCTKNGTRAPLQKKDIRKRLKRTKG